ncbi:TPA: hypothetical protein O8U42_000875 [Enterobacter hormaechei]|nr:hypothetical protein [Enterobacter hormaechei]
MSTLTKEWLQKTIAELEEERDATPGAVNEDAAKALAAMKLALASLEDEPVAFRSKLKSPSAIGSERWEYTDHRQPDAFELQNCVIERLYAAPPAPVSVLDEKQSRELFENWCSVNIERNKWHPEYYAHYPATGQWRAWEACRAAMLQGAEQTNYRAIVERIAEIIHGKVTDIDLLTVTVKSMKDKLQN